MRRILIIFIIGLSIAGVAHADPTVGTPNGQYGTCEAYHPGFGGDFCVQDGAASFWQKFFGDVTNDTRNTPQCSPTNTSRASGNSPNR